MENALATANCMKASDTADFPVAKWVCVEWNIDAAKKEMHLWRLHPSTVRLLRVHMNMRYMLAV